MAFQPHPFPINILGLQRGTILEATDEIVWKVRMEIGDHILLGFDGEYVRCSSYAWSIDQIVDEIQRGVWKIVGHVDLSDEERSLKFARDIEHLQV